MQHSVRDAVFPRARKGNDWHTRVPIVESLRVMELYGVLLPLALVVFCQFYGAAVSTTSVSVVSIV